MSALVTAAGEHTGRARGMSTRWSGMRTLASLAGGLVIGLVLLMVGRSLIESALVRLDESRAVHPDRSVFASGVERPPVRRFTLRFDDADGRARAVALDAAEAAALAATVQARLASARSLQGARIELLVRARTLAVEQAALARVEDYADWYFAWATTYRLLLVAARSASQQVLAPRLMDLDDAVAAELGQYLRARYEAKVLEPEITDPKLRAAFVGALADLHGQYLRTLEAVADEVRAFALERPAAVPAATPAAVTVEIDWASQLRKLKVTSHERGGLDAVARLGVIGLSSMIGSRAPLPLAASAGAASRRALVRFWPRLAAPVAGRAVAPVGFAAAGTAALGPLGAALGAGAGLLVDYGVNEAEEAVGRDAFEAEVRHGLAATFAEWRAAMASELGRTTDVWFDQAMAELSVLRP